MTCRHCGFACNPVASSRRDSHHCFSVKFTCSEHRSVLKLMDGLPDATSVRRCPLAGALLCCRRPKLHTRRLATVAVDAGRLCTLRAVIRTHD
ncbi:hypothetical protein ACFPRL_25050 [Pseudoclavibacter helvolus]